VNSQSSKRNILKQLKNSSIKQKLNYIYEKFKQFYRFLITNKWGKCIIGVIFVIYISFSTYNTMKIKEGLEISDLVAHDSYYGEFSRQNFGEFDLELPVMIIIDQPIDYTSSAVRKKIRKFLGDLQKIKGINKEFLINWMNLYKLEFKIMAKTNNTDLILNQMLNSTSPFQNDFVVGFNQIKNRKEIIASRFFIKYEKTWLSSKDAIIMNNIKDLCKSFDISFKAYSG
jgi:hypothetical protein